MNTTEVVLFRSGGKIFAGNGAEPVAPGAGQRTGPEQGAESGSSEGWYGRPGATYLDVPRRHHHRQMRVPLCHLDIVGDALDALDAVREFAERRGDQHFF